MHKQTYSALAVLSATVLVAGACGDTPATPTDVTTALVAVTPAGGDTGVDPNSLIVLQFSHAMGMDMYVALHEGSGVSGGLVDGTRAWSADRMRLTFTPASSLMSPSPYTIHIGGGMLDENGNVVDLDQHGHGLGGDWVTQQMMNDRMMMGGGMMDGDMMGPGWQHPTNGMFGMTFSFTTG
jgi:hypothetical protein